MSGDWIKMRCELQTHPKIVRILSATKADKFRVVGGLHAVWSVFDAHSKDGSLFGYTPETLDHVIGWDGFAAALLLVNWLVYDGNETLTLPEFDEHNSKSAKRRAEDQKRKRDDRKSPQIVLDESGQNADKMRTREEKRREDIKPKPIVTGKPVDDCPHEQIIELYHAALPTMPSIKVWTEKRRTLLRARWREDEKRQSVEYWEKFFGYVAKSNFLCGRTEKPFNCDLEWMLNASNFVKIIEGKYHAVA